MRRYVFHALPVEAAALRGEWRHVDRGYGGVGDAGASGEHIWGMGRRDNEKPTHKVYLSSYYLYNNLVTVAQYLKFCDVTGRSMPEASAFNPNWSMRNHPIVRVSRADAQAYCRWAGVSLPTQAQWEKAARSTDGRQYPWGQWFDCSKCANSVDHNGFDAPHQLRRVVPGGIILDYRNNCPMLLAGGLALTIVCVIGTSTLAGQVQTEKAPVARRSSDSSVARTNPKEGADMVLVRAGRPGS